MEYAPKPDLLKLVSPNQQWQKRAPANSDSDLDYLEMGIDAEHFKEVPTRDSHTQ